MTCAMRLVARMADDMYKYTGWKMQLILYSFDFIQYFGVLSSSRRKIVPSCIPTIDDERYL